MLTFFVYKKVDYLFVFNISLVDISAVVCGIPPSGINTAPVVPTSIVYPNSYTYSCIANFETGGSLESKCLADGSWSLQPAPTCTRK